VHDVYEFHIDDSVISVIVDDGERGTPAERSTWRSTSTKPRSSTGEWGALADATQSAKGS
jgi:hypothetical protein